MAARALAAKGKKVKVLEARGRVGGRTLNHDIGKGDVIEVGGEAVVGRAGIVTAGVADAADHRGACPFQAQVIHRIAALDRGRPLVVDVPAQLAVDGLVGRAIARLLGTLVPLVRSPV